MITRMLVPINWAVWGVLLLASLYMLVRASTERVPSPGGGRGLGVVAALFVLAVLAVGAVALTAAARRQSPAGLMALTVFLVWPGALLIARPAVMAYRERSFANAEARVGDFEDATLASMARAIAGNDTATLARLLGGQPPGEGKDRAGNDLLAYALVVVRDKHGSAPAVRVLLDAGADPRKTRMGSGEDVITYLVRGQSPDVYGAMRLLLDHGADPNVVDSQTGDTPLGTVYNDPETVRLLVEHGADMDRIQSDGTPAVVEFIGSQQWESALYLIEKGANLDLANADGLSVDYYLNAWRESIHGQHHDGWDRVRAAIAVRRAARAIGMDAAR